MAMPDPWLGSISDAVITKNYEDGKAHFSDLPKEIRIMIYALSRPFSTVMIANAPHHVHQPSISKVCKAMRVESLDVFYGKSNFMLDMRHSMTAWGESWKPSDVFYHWIAAIGDENAARLRKVSFYLYNFSVHFSLHSGTNKPRIIAKLRDTTATVFKANQNNPNAYTMGVAMGRAEKRLAFVVQRMLLENDNRRLDSGDICKLCDLVVSLGPALCRNHYGPEVDDDPSKPIPKYQDVGLCHSCSY